MSKQLLSVVLLFPLITLVLFFGKQSKDKNWAEIVNVPSSAGSSQPQLHTDDKGHVWMSWIESVDSVRASFRYSKFDGNAWSKPQTIVTSSDMITRGPDTPSFLILPRGKLAAQYSISNSSEWMAYDVHITQGDEVGNWRESVIPHSDKTKTQHGFASLIPLKDDRIQAVWLDGRKTKLEQGVTDESEWGEMNLWGATINADGEVEAEHLLDSRVCDCCPTTAVSTKSGALIAYRDRTKDETRDISLIRFNGNKWSKPYKLHSDNWKIRGCPVNGPAMDARGDQVVIAWYTATDNTAAIKVAFSDNGGQEFGDPIIVDRRRGLRGQTDVVLLPDNTAVVSWIGSDRKKINNRNYTVQAIKIRHVQPDGSMGEKITINQPKSTAFTGRPSLANSGNEIFLAWVDVLGNPDSTLIHMAHRSLNDVK